MNAVLKNRNFMWLLLSQTTNRVGDEIRTWSVVFWVYFSSGHSPVVQAMIMAANVAPSIILGPLSGVWVDRWDRRKIVICAETFRSVLSLALIPALRYGSPALTLIIVALNAAVAQFSHPVYGAVLPSLVSKQDLTTAVGLRQTTGNVTTLLGPVIGSGLYYLVGPQAAFALDALSSIIAVVTMYLVEYRPGDWVNGPRTTTGSAWTTFWQDFGLGLKRAWGTPAIRSLVVSFITMSSALGAVGVLNIVFVTRELALPQQYAAWASTALGFGTVGTSLIASFYGKRIRSHQWLYVSGMIVLSLGLAGLAMSTNGWTMLASRVVLGIGVTSLSVAASALFMIVVPQDFLGRIGAFLDTALTFSGLSVAMVVGYLAQWISCRIIFLFSGLLLAWTAYYAIAHRQNLGPAQSEPGAGIPER